MAATSKENHDPPPLISTDGKTRTKFKAVPVDRSRYTVFQMHLTEDMVHYTAKDLVEELLNGLIKDDLTPEGIMRNGDVIEVTYADPTPVTMKRMGSRTFTQKGVHVHFLMDDDPMVIVNIRGNDFRHPMIEACGLVAKYGKIVHCYRQVNAYRGNRIENGIIAVWLRDVQAKIPTKFDKRRSCFYNMEKVDVMLAKTAMKAAGVKIVGTTPPVKTVVKPSVETGGGVANLAASVETSVPRQVMNAGNIEVAASVEPTVTRPSGDEVVAAVAGISDGAASVEPASTRRLVTGDLPDRERDQKWDRYPVYKNEADIRIRRDYWGMHAVLQDAFMRLFNELQSKEVDSYSWSDVSMESKRRRVVARKQMKELNNEAAATGESPVTDEPHEVVQVNTTEDAGDATAVFTLAQRDAEPSPDVSSDGERHHQCGLCSKKFHTLDHLKYHALHRHADTESEESMEGIEDIRPGVERTPGSDGDEDVATLGTKELRVLKKKELQKRHSDKHSGKVKKKSAQRKER